MDIWEEKFHIKKEGYCKRTATCCRSATSYQPWKKIHIASKDQNLKDFFNIFIPYESHETVKNIFPEAYEACIDVVKERKDINLKDVYFYYCRFFQPPNICPIYEDRPSLCRNFPESPFDAIPRTCGYYEWGRQCKKNYFKITQELAQLKFTQYMNSPFFILPLSISSIKLV